MSGNFIIFKLNLVFQWVTVIIIEIRMNSLLIKQLCIWGEPKGNTGEGGGGGGAGGYI